MLSPHLLVRLGSTGHVRDVPVALGRRAAPRRRRLRRAFSANTEVLIVGPDRDAADDLARRATEAQGATFGLHRASLAQLVVHFAAAEMARLGVAPATMLGAEAIAARVSFKALRDLSLRM